MLRTVVFRKEDVDSSDCLSNQNHFQKNEIVAIAIEAQCLADDLFLPTINLVLPSEAHQGASQNHVSARTISAAMVSFAHVLNGAENGTSFTNLESWECDDVWRMFCHAAGGLLHFLKCETGIRYFADAVPLSLLGMPQSACTKPTYDYSILHQELFFALVSMVAASADGTNKYHTEVAVLLKKHLDFLPARSAILQGGQMFKLALELLPNLPIPLASHALSTLWGQFPDTNWANLQGGISLHSLMLSWQSLTDLMKKHLISSEHLPLRWWHLMQQWVAPEPGILAEGVRIVLACCLLSSDMIHHSLDSVLAEKLREKVCSAGFKATAQIETSDDQFEKDIACCALASALFHGKEGSGVVTMPPWWPQAGLNSQSWLSFLMHGVFELLLTNRFGSHSPPLISIATPLGRSYAQAAVGMNVPMWLPNLSTCYQDLSHHFRGTEPAPAHREEVHTVWDSWHNFACGVCEVLVAAPKTLDAHGTAYMVSILATFPSVSNSQQAAAVKKTTPLLEKLQKEAENNGVFYLIIQDFPELAGLSPGNQAKETEPRWCEMAAHRLWVYLHFLEVWLPWIIAVPALRNQLQQQILGTLLAGLDFSVPQVNAAIHPICCKIFSSPSIFQSIKAPLTPEEAQRQFICQYLSRSILHFPEITSSVALGTAIGMVIGFAHEDQNSMATVLYCIGILAKRAQALWIDDLESGSFMNLEFYHKKTSEHREIIAAILFQTLKLVSLKCIEDAFAIVELFLQEVFKCGDENDKSLILEVLYSSISTKCDDTRRKFLFDWFLRIHMQSKL